MMLVIPAALADCQDGPPFEMDAFRADELKHGKEQCQAQRTNI
jgi:hypothetical protein